jgi:hypothetical protein
MSAAGQWRRSGLGRAVLVHPANQIRCPSGRRSLGPRAEIGALSADVPFPLKRTSDQRWFPDNGSGHSIITFCEIQSGGGQAKRYHRTQKVVRNRRLDAPINFRV